MTPSWRIKATKTEDGFSLRRIDSEADLGEALDAGIHRGGQIVVVMDDGRELGLFSAVAELIESRVVEITVRTELNDGEAVPLSDCRHSDLPKERVHY